MSSRTVKQACINATKNRLALLGFPVSWPGKTITPPQGATWCAVHYTSQDPQVIGLGDEGESEVQGFIQIDVCVPTGTGEGVQEDALDDLEAWFEAGRQMNFGGQSAVVTSSSRTGAPRVVDGVSKHSLTVYFYGRFFRRPLTADPVVLTGLPYVSSVLMASGGQARYEWYVDDVLIEDNVTPFYVVRDVDLFHDIRVGSFGDMSDALGIVDIPPFPVYKLDVDFADGTKPDSLTYSDAGFTVTNERPAGFSHSLRFPPTGDQTEPIVSATVVLAVAGMVRFWRKVSSELNFDKFYFKIDGVNLQVASGEEPWQGFVFQLSAGSHLLQWSYAKDQSDGSGQDTAWVTGIQVLEGTFP